jgi:hypothetical protein
VGRCSGGGSRAGSLLRVSGVEDDEEDDADQVLDSEGVLEGPAWDDTLPLAGGGLGQIIAGCRCGVSVKHWSKRHGSTCNGETGPSVDRTHNSRSTEGHPCTALQRPGRAAGGTPQRCCRGLGERQHGDTVERTVAEGRWTS